MSKSRKNENKEIKLDVLMIGARRCGKSSALYAMMNQFERFLSENDGQGIKLLPTEATTAIMNARFGQNSPENMFDNADMSKRWQSDENQDFAANTYEYEVVVEGAANQYTISFTDVPGEWFAPDAQEENKKQLKDLLNKSNILMICLDTPHLVEGKRSPYANFNFPEVIASYITGMEYRNEEGVILPRLILFVPIKCEKYYHKQLTGIDAVDKNYSAKDLQYVNTIIKKEYKDIIDMAKNPASEGAYTVAVTPILTLGDVVFDDFGRDENGKVKRNPYRDDIAPALRGRPESAYYKFYSSYENAAPHYNPKYCEQPLLYILLYMIKLNEQEGRGRGRTSRITPATIIKAFALGLLNVYAGIVYFAYKMASDRKFVNAVETACNKYMMVGADGFEILEDSDEVFKK